MERAKGDELESSSESDKAHADRRASRTEESTSSEAAMAQSDDIDHSVVDESAYSGDPE
jgi:hypothetical protein